MYFLKPGRLDTKTLSLIGLEWVRMIREWEGRFQRRVIFLLTNDYKVFYYHNYLNILQEIVKNIYILK